MTTLMYPLTTSKEELESCGNRCFSAYLLTIQYFIYFANVSLQLLFIFSIGAIANNIEEKCTQTDPVLLWLTSVLFYTLIVRDLQESVNMLFWLYYFPPSDDWKELRYTKTEPKEIASGMRRWYKFYCAIFIVTPKIVIIAYLGKDGGKWLMSAQSNQDLILNCVALFFITELDEIINHNLVPRPVATVVEEMPDIRWPPKEDENDYSLLQVCSLGCGTIMSVVVIMSITIIGYTENCGWDHPFTNGALFNVSDLVSPA